jgi:hypothetical protein
LRVESLELRGSWEKESATNRLNIVFMFIVLSKNLSIIAYFSAKIVIIIYFSLILQINIKLYPE